MFCKVKVKAYTYAIYCYIYIEFSRSLSHSISNRSYSNGSYSNELIYYSVHCPSNPIVCHSVVTLCAAYSGPQDIITSPGLSLVLVTASPVIPWAVRNNRNPLNSWSCLLICCHQERLNPFEGRALGPVRRLSLSLSCFTSLCYHQRGHVKTMRIVWPLSNKGTWTEDVGFFIQTSMLVSSFIPTRS